MRCSNSARGSPGRTSVIYPVPKALVVTVLSVESGFRPRAVSRVGAKALMQLMPYTARRVGIAERELFNPRRNVLGGVRLLAVLVRHYEGDVISALAAYDARPRRLFAPIPRNGERRRTCGRSRGGPTLVREHPHRR
jgi:soluble lytic murein transglycosylase-like protein